MNSTFSGNNDFQSKLDAANIPLGQISRIKVSLANYLFGSVIKYRIHLRTEYHRYIIHPQLIFLSTVLKFKK